MESSDGCFHRGALDLVQARTLVIDQVSHKEGLSIVLIRGHDGCLSHLLAHRGEKTAADHFGPALSLLKLFLVYPLYDLFHLIVDLEGHNHMLITVESLIYLLNFRFPNHLCIIEPQTLDPLDFQAFLVETRCIRHCDILGHRLEKGGVACHINFRSV